jgi:phosphatidate cytidylyltransferase
MLKRTLTALLMIPPVVYLIGWSPKWLFLLAVAFGVVLALREYFALCHSMGLNVFDWLGYGAGVLVCVAQVFRGGGLAVIFVLAACLLVIPTLALRRSVDLRDYLMATSATIFGILYIGLSLSYLLPIRFSTELFRDALTTWADTSQPLGLGIGPRLLLFLFLVIWAGDIGAYLVGRSVGRIPFFPRISPRKTWEGALAGLAASILAAWAFAHWFLISANLTAVLLIAAWIAVAGQIGDLVESAIKRGAHQKDSGTLLPGH